MNTEVQATPAGDAPEPKISTRNAAVTRKKILDAATKEFAGLGFDGARVDQIALRAGVNKQMLYHYFGSKDELFTSALENAYSKIRRSEEKLDLDDLPANEAILVLVEFTWRYYLRHPEFIRLLNSENQMDARHMKSSSNSIEINRGYLSLMRSLLDRGRREGTVRPDVDAMQANINIASLGFFYLINRHTLSWILERDLMSKEALDERLVVMKDTIARWLAPVV